MRSLQYVAFALVLALSSPVAFGGSCGSCGAGGHKQKVSEGEEKGCCGKCGGAGKEAKACTAGEKKCCGTCGGKQAHSHAAATLTVDALSALLDSGSDVVVLDARSGKYDDGRRIPGAKSLTDKVSAREAKKVIGNKDQLVVTYCSNTKCPASAKLAARLHGLGYENVLELPVGIAGWTEAGKTVETVK